MPVWYQPAQEKGAAAPCVEKEERKRLTCPLSTSYSLFPLFSAFPRLSRSTRPAALTTRWYVCSGTFSTREMQPLHCQRPEGPYLRWSSRSGTAARLTHIPDARRLCCRAARGRQRNGRRPWNPFWRSSRDGMERQRGPARPAHWLPPPALVPTWRRESMATTKSCHQGQCRGAALGSRAARLKRIAAWRPRALSQSDHRQSVKCMKRRHRQAWGSDPGDALSRECRPTRTPAFSRRPCVLGRLSTASRLSRAVVVLQLMRKCTRACSAPARVFSHEPPDLAFPLAATWPSAVGHPRTLGACLPAANTTLTVYRRRDVRQLLGPHGPLGSWCRLSYRA